VFQSREEAGQLLSTKLSKYQKDKYAIVLGIPRGGVVVGNQIAKLLNISFSAVVVKKLSAPDNPELAIGAIAPENVKVIDWDLALRSGVEQGYLDEEVEKKRKEVEERIKKYSRSSGIHDATDAHSSQAASGKISNYKTIILTDDGVATGATVLAALKYIKNIRLAANDRKLKTILAVPVIARDTYNKLKSEVDPDQIGVDEIIALEIPESFSAVGQFYNEFPQVTDEEVMKML